MRRRRLSKFLRYASVSAVATTTSLSVLGVAVGLLGMAAGWANVLATAVGTVPSFELNRRWVWGKGGRRSVRAEVIPFVALSFAGLAISTLAVHTAATWADGRGWSSLARTALVMTTNLISFGSLWVFQFVLLDRLLFRSPDTAGRRHVPDAGDEAPPNAPSSQGQPETPARWLLPQTAPGRSSVSAGHPSAVAPTPTYLRAAAPPARLTGEWK